MIFELPTKEIIVNSDAQVRLLEDDGTVYAAADVVGGTSGGFILEGFLGLTMATELVLLAPAKRIIKEAQVAGTAEVSTYTLTTAVAVVDTVFRLVTDSLDYSPTVFQNRGYEKRYQIPAQTTAAGVGAALVAAINADVNSPVVASGGATLTLTAKLAGTVHTLYSSDYVLPAKVTTTPATVGINNYSNLINVEWSKNVDIDRNLAYYPAQGGEYTSFYFKTLKSSPDGGDDHFPTSSLRTTTQDFRVYTREGSALETALNLLVTDVNV